MKEEKEIEEVLGVDLPEGITLKKLSGREKSKILAMVHNNQEDFVKLETGKIPVPLVDEIYNVLKLMYDGNTEDLDISEAMSAFGRVGEIFDKKK